MKRAKNLRSTFYYVYELMCQYNLRGQTFKSIDLLESIRILFISIIRNQKRLN